VVVTEELKAKIVKQVEFYFSDTNLPTDHHLMKYVKKDPQGFVPIPVVASFKKIKNLVKNHGVVAAALRNSLQLVVSEDGKKVRRLHPLPEIDLEEVQARTVVAENLPIDCSVEKLEELFGKVGSVKMVRICHPEAPNGGNQTAVKLPKSDMVISNKVGFPIPLLQNSEAIAVKSCGSQG
jgi:La-related protein 7